MLVPRVTTRQLAGVVDVMDEQRSGGTCHQAARLVRDPVNRLYSMLFKVHYLQPTWVWRFVELNMCFILNIKCLSFISKCECN